MGEARPVRFGVLCERAVMPAWQARAIEMLIEHCGAELAVWVRPASETARENGRHARGARVHGLAYRAICEVLLGPAQIAPRDMSPVLSATRQMSWDGLEASNREISACDLEFILDFRDPRDFRRAAEETQRSLPPARHGVWAVRAEDSDPGSGSYAVFWSVMKSRSVVSAELWRSGGTAASGESVLARASFRVFGHSFGSTLGSVLGGMSELPARACAELRSGCSSIKPSAVARPAPGVPSTFDVVRFCLRTIGLLARRGYSALFRHSQWNVGLIREPISRFLDPDWRPEIEWLPAPRSHSFRADPFGLARDGKIYLLFEDFGFSEDIGRIDWMALDQPGIPAGEIPAGAPLQGMVAIGGPVHLSYPYLLEHEGEIYCIPESFQSGEVALYRAVEFPQRWQKVTTLLAGVAGCDPTVFRHGGLWWLACTEQYSEPNARLSLWYSTRLEGPWTAHARNPVKSDPRSARPAGTPFTHMGQLYRPAQDSSESYGRRVVINRVVKLTPDEFEETPEVVAGPFAGTKYPDGVHTLSAVGDFTVVDGRKTCFDRRAFLSALMRVWTQRQRARGTPLRDPAALPASPARAD